VISRPDRLRAAPASFVWPRISVRLRQPPVCGPQQARRELVLGRGHEFEADGDGLRAARAHGKPASKVPRE